MGVILKYGYFVDMISLGVLTYAPYLPKSSRIPFLRVEHVRTQTLNSEVAKIPIIVGRGFKSFNEFKRVMGSAGSGYAWLHIVEQTPANLAKFGPDRIHNTANLIRLPHGKGSIHAKVSGYYSSKQFFTQGKTVREWLSQYDYEFQYQFGINTLEKFGWTVK